MRVLTAHVWVDGELYLTGSTPPADVADRITAPVWAELPDDPEPTEPEGGEVGAAEPMADPAVQVPPVPVPPMHGAGSSTEAWAGYARTHGVEVADDAKRADVIAALTAAGIPVE
jgi:hypothetical protein